MRFQRISALAAAVAAISLALTACGSNDGSTGGGGQVTLKVWDQFTDGGTSEAAKQIYADFEKANPDIKIDAESYRFDDLAQLGKTALASGTGPDVMYFDAGLGEAGQLAESDLIVPLDDYAEEYGWTDKINEEIRTWSTYDGKLFGLGLEGEFNSLFANDSLIEKAGLTVPTTYDELLDFCGAAKDAGYVPIAYGQGPAVYAKDMYAMVAQNIVGADSVHDLIFDNQGSFNSPEMAKAIDIWFSQMNDAGCFPDGVNGLSVDNAALLFHGSKALMLAGGTWQIGDIYEKMPDSDVTMMPFPTIEGGAGQFYPLGVGSAWVISADGDNQDAAAKFLDYMYSPDAVDIWMTKGGIIPPVATDLDSLDLQPMIKQAAQLVQQGQDDAGSQLGYYIWPRWSGQLFNLFQDGAQAVTAGSKAPQELADEVQKQWESDGGQ